MNHHWPFVQRRQQPRCAGKTMRRHCEWRLIASGLNPPGNLRLVLNYWQRLLPGYYCSGLSDELAVAVVL